jgi:hypothetical protein
MEHWIQNISGYLELIDGITGEVLAREKRRTVRAIKSGGRRPGRPSKEELAKREAGHPVYSTRLYPFDPVIGEMICNAIEEGERLCSMDRRHSFPPYREICRWRAENPAFNRRVIEAMRFRAEFFADKVVEIADNLKSGDDVAAARLMFDSLKWAACNADPERYRAKCGAPVRKEQPIQFVVTSAIDIENNKK